MIPTNIIHYIHELPAPNNVVKENRMCLQNKAADKIFDFLSLDHYEFTHESVIRLLPRSVDSESWKLGTGITITTKQAASSKASSKSTRTVLLQNSVLAKESEVSES